MFNGHEIHVEVKVAASVADAVLATHDVHIPGPVVVLYDPFGQLVQAAVPVSTLNFPAGQAMHAVPFGPEYPERHEQFTRRVLTGSENEKAGHAVHVPGPVDTLYVPVSHAVHATPSTDAK